MVFLNLPSLAAPKERPTPIKDDLRRGMAVLKESTPLYSMPRESSETIDRETLEVQKRYYVLGLSLDGQWAQILTRKNIRGWVLLGKLQRIPDTDSDLQKDFVKLVDRQHWTTKRYAANLGVYSGSGGIVGELAFSALPLGFAGLKGESFDLVAGGIWVAKTSQVSAHLAYHALLQWAFRSGPEGNLYIGPRIGYENRRMYDALSVNPVRNEHNGIMGVLFRYMPNHQIGFSLMPEFLIQFRSPNQATLRTLAAVTIMF